MPTLHHRARKSERASTKASPLKKASRSVARKPPVKKKARQYAAGSALGSVVREDAVDIRLIREAREADKGRARYSVNELRAQRGLSGI